MRCLSVTTLKKAEYRVYRYSQNVYRLQRRVFWFFWYDCTENPSISVEDAKETLAALGKDDAARGEVTYL